MTFLLVICFFKNGTLFLFFNHTGLTEGDSVVPLADASLHLALPQNPSSWKVLSSRGLVLVFVLFGSSVLGMAAGYIQVFRSHMLLSFSVCTQWSWSSSLQNVASNSPAFVLAALCPGLINLQNVQLSWLPTLLCVVCSVAVVVLLNMHTLRVRAHLSLLWSFRD